MSIPNQGQSTFINLHISGIGFLNRVRMVSPKHGEAFMAVTIGLQEGEVVEGDYSRVTTTYVDCRVSGAQAFDILNDFVLKGKVDQANTTVRAVVKTGGLNVDTFTYAKGPKAGQTGVSLKGRLLYIRRLYIDGNECDLSSYQETDAVDVAPNGPAMPAADTQVSAGPVQEA
ncbi:MAG: DUF3577 domain-containing protein [Gammaproteobacteria bacterium]|nr:DUF3577 domain-containing protein [Gammaproteobacteria bacterium]